MPTKKPSPPVKRQAKTPTKRATARKSAGTAPPTHKPTRGLFGWITHTEFASANPLATKAWCAKVLGWTFNPPITMPGGTGEYHMFRYSDKGGGGIHLRTAPEPLGSVPFVHVADAHVAYDIALSEGAEGVSPPTRIMEGVTIAMVRAPGGVTIGLSGP